MAKTRPIYLARPADGSRVDDDQQPPAIDAVAIEMLKAMRLMRTGSTAISCSA